VFGGGECREVEVEARLMGGLQKKRLGNRTGENGCSSDPRAETVDVVVTVYENTQVTVTRYRSRTSQNLYRFMFTLHI